MVGYNDGYGAIVRSTNTGVYWQSIISGSTSATKMSDIATLTPLGGAGGNVYQIAVSLSGYVYVSSDGGASFPFSSLLSTTLSLTGITIGRKGNSVRAFAVGALSTYPQYPQVWMSAGPPFTAWTSSLTTSSTPVLLTAVSSLNGVNVIAVGYGGAVMYTTNATASPVAWKLVKFSTTAVGALPNLQCVSMGAPLVALAAGDSATIIRTTDGGQTWTSVASSVISRVGAGSFKFHAIAMVSATYAFASASSGAIFRTVDQGATWTVESQSGSTVEVLSIGMYNSFVGAAGVSRSPVVLVRSIDVPTGQPTQQPSRQPSHVPSAQPSRLPSSQPSTRPSRQPSSRPSRQPTRQPTAKPSRVPSTQPSIQPTYQPTSRPSRQPSSQPSRQPQARPSARPSGQPSQRPSGLPSSHPTKYVYPTGQPSSQPTGFVFTHASFTWNVAFTGSTSNVILSAVWTSSTTVVAAGYQYLSNVGVILRSESAGYAWTKVHVASAFVKFKYTDIAAYWPANGGVGTVSLVAVANTGTISVSTDGGSTWVDVGTSGTAVSSALTGVSIGTSGVAFAVADASSAFPLSVYSSSVTSKPAFSSWVNLTPGVGTAQTHLEFLAVSTFDGVQVVAVGRGGLIYYSTNAGLSWSAPANSMASADLYCVASGSKRTFLAAGDGGAVVRSMDGGATWTNLTARVVAAANDTAFEGFRFHAVAMLTEAVAFLADIQGAVLRTSDSGRSFVLETLLTPASSGSTAFYSLAMYRPASTSSSSLPTLKGVVGLVSDNGGYVYVKAISPTAAPATPRPTHEGDTNPPTQPSSQPTTQPSSQPSSRPSRQPYSRPSSQPTRQPLARPSRQPTSQPTHRPSHLPSSRPSRRPNRAPTSRPSSQPASRPSRHPSSQPTSRPSRQPILRPTSHPTYPRTPPPSYSPSSEPTRATSRPTYPSADTVTGLRVAQLLDGLSATAASQAAFATKFQAAVSGALAVPLFSIVILAVNVVVAVQGDIATDELGSEPARAGLDAVGRLEVIGDLDRRHAGERPRTNERAKTTTSAAVEKGASRDGSDVGNAVSEGSVEREGGAGTTARRARTGRSEGGVSAEEEVLVQGPRLGASTGQLAVGTSGRARTRGQNGDDLEAGGVDNERRLGVSGSGSGSVQMLYEVDVPTAQAQATSATLAQVVASGVFTLYLQNAGYPGVTATAQPQVTFFTPTWMPTPQPQAPVASPTGGNGNAGTLAGIVIGVILGLLLCGGGFYYLYRRNTVIDDEYDTQHRSNTNQVDFNELELI